MCNPTPQQLPILHQINTFSNTQIEDWLRRDLFELGCLIKYNINAEKLNELDLDLLKARVAQEGISENTLLEGGMTRSRIDEILGNSVQQEPDPDPIEDTPFSSAAPGLIDRIRGGYAMVSEIQAALFEDLISENQLRNQCGLSSDMIKRIRAYKPVQMPPIEKALPPLKPNRTDCYFLGLPSAGKTCLIASLLSYWINEGICNPEVDNQRSIDYFGMLGGGFSRGVLPMNTPNAFVDYIQLTLKTPVIKKSFWGTREEEVHIPINLLDMAGERFSNVVKKGSTAFDSHAAYFSNNNSKAIFFILDYSSGGQDDHGAIYDQNLSLMTVLNNLDAMGILENTDTVFLLVTKADLFPFSGNLSETAEKYVRSQRYRAFYNRLDQLKKQHDFSTKLLPYSIGPSVFGQLLKDYNPETNENLTTYPKMLSKEIINLTAKYSPGIF